MEPISPPILDPVAEDEARAKALKSFISPFLTRGFHEPSHARFARVYEDREAFTEESKRLVQDFLFRGSSRFVLAYDREAPAWPRDIRNWTPYCGPEPWLEMTPSQIRRLDRERILKVAAERFREEITKVFDRMTDEKLNISGQPVGVFLAVENPDLPMDIWYGWSRLHKGDRWDRYVGIRKAILRLKPLEELSGTRDTLLPEEGVPIRFVLNARKALSRKYRDKTTAE